MDMTADAKKQKNLVLNITNINIGDLDENVDISNILRLAIVVKYCCNPKVHE